MTTTGAPTPASLRNSPSPIDRIPKRRTKTNHPPMAPMPIPAVSERTQIDPRRKHLTTDQSHRSHRRSPTKLNPNVTPPPAKWNALIEAMKDPRLSSADAAKELETAAAALEARINDADETRESLTHGDDEYGYVHSRPLGTGLVSCGSCGRTLAAEALVSHRKENCAWARRALGAEGVARALGGVWGAVDVPQAPAAAVVPAASPPKPAKKMTKKALKEQAAAAAAAGMGVGTGTGVAPGAQPMQAMQGVGGALTHRGSPAYDLQHLLFLQQQHQQQQQQGGQMRRVNSAQLASLGPNDFELASGPLGMGASAPMPGVVPPLTAAEKKAAGAKRKREAKAAAAKAAKVAGLSGGPTAQQPQQQPQPPQQQPGAPVTPGMYDAATLAQLNAQTARHIQQRRAAMAHRLAQQQRQRAQMEVERERNHGWTGISPLARVADVGRLRHLRQRALYSIMFHGTQQELLERMSPNIVPAQMYLSGASEVLPPFPAVTG